MEKCRALLNAGANVNVRDGNENTPLMGAATYGMLETVDFLIKAKAELNAVDRIGATALMKVMALVLTRITRMLVSSIHF
jgi:ankyrin repeat protein